MWLGRLKHFPYKLMVTASSLYAIFGLGKLYFQTARETCILETRPPPATRVSIKCLVYCKSLGMMSQKLCMYNKKHFHWIEPRKFLFAKRKFLSQPHPLESSTAKTLKKLHKLLHTTGIFLQSMNQ